MERKASVGLGPLEPPGSMSVVDDGWPTGPPARPVPGTRRPPSPVLERRRPLSPDTEIALRVACAVLVNDALLAEPVQTMAKPKKDDGRGRQQHVPPPASRGPARAAPAARRPSNASDMAPEAYVPQNAAMSFAMTASSSQALSRLPSIDRPPSQRPAAHGPRPGTHDGRGTATAMSPDAASPTEKPAVDRSLSRGGRLLCYLRSQASVEWLSTPPAADGLARSWWPPRSLRRRTSHTGPHSLPARTDLDLNRALPPLPSLSTWHASAWGDLDDVKALPVSPTNDDRMGLRSKFSDMAAAEARTTNGRISPSDRITVVNPATKEPRSTPPRPHQTPSRAATATTADTTLTGHTRCARMDSSRGQDAAGPNTSPTAAVVKAPKHTPGTTSPRLPVDRPSRTAKADHHPAIKISLFPETHTHQHLQRKPILRRAPSSGLGPRTRPTGNGDADGKGKPAHPSSSSLSSPLPPPLPTLTRKESTSNKVRRLLTIMLGWQQQQQQQPQPPKPALLLLPTSCGPGPTAAAAAAVGGTPSAREDSSLRLCAVAVDRPLSAQ
ncbi:MAG: hypothetical protein M1826_004374 [Phylliscum demangeonii]|nr:MAG: hypothetical protein M1826_004374 [Phylliscum demangeonii]